MSKPVAEALETDVARRQLCDLDMSMPLTKRRTVGGEVMEKAFGKLMWLLTVWGVLLAGKRSLVLKTPIWYEAGLVDSIHETPAEYNLLSLHVSACTWQDEAVI